VQFLHPACSGLAPEKQANFVGLGAEQLGQGLLVVALARQSWLRIIDIVGNDRIDEFGADRLLADFVALCQGVVQVSFDLEGRGQPLREVRQGLFRHDGMNRHLRRRALLKQPSNIAGLLLADVIQLKERGPGANLFHCRPFQTILEPGMTRQHHRQRPAAVAHDFDQPLQTEQRLGVEVMERRRLAEQWVSGGSAPDRGARLPAVPVSGDFDIPIRG
jgi:hypothetical protein